LKPLSVTLPYAARFTDGGDASRAQKRIQQISESGNRDSDEVGRDGGAGAVFDLAPSYRVGVGPASSGR
jgi:hypothetical protein